ncbi:hypothetical protein NM688_g8400 [Phlebia brevispora]|uniref:Uncharacterized protein n=1 Tax=Phlebia brevispora TaxID=194682 RepID=A0ACC1RT14_9APHY|nr:hypothetical protein NM688_g8400 [Phlebia brevispora]
MASTYRHLSSAGLDIQCERRLRQYAHARRGLGVTRSPTAYPLVTIPWRTVSSAVHQTYANHRARPIDLSDCAEALSHLLALVFAVSDSSLPPGPPTRLFFIMGKFPMSAFISEQRTTLAPPLQSDLSNKTVLITGGNTGIGFEAVKTFAKQHPKKLLLGCRSESKGKSAAERIEKETGYRGIELAILDSGDFNSIVKFAENFKDEPLDILIANAGIAIGEYEETKDGWESGLQVNHLSTALLAVLLLPNLVRTAQKHGTHSRLVIVSSDTHYWTKFDEEMLDAPSILRKLNDREFCTTEVMAHRYYDTKCEYSSFM